jgi:hypothetical protein
MTHDRKICAFIAHYCLIPEGAKVGPPITLMKFQRKKSKPGRGNIK